MPSLFSLFFFDDGLSKKTSNRLSNPFSSPLLSNMEEKKKPAPVGVANVERRTWNEQEYEEKAAQRDEEVRH